MSAVSITKDCILINGKPTKIVSGAMHYFRVFPEYWEDRLLKLKELGCNCVETYIAWNFHEEKEGVFDFSGKKDFMKFIAIAKKLGLYVILRPGPFICSEWDMGGLPWWLLKYKDIELRTYNKTYLEKCTKYLEQVCKLIKPEMIDNGGNIIFVQIENEFGSYGNDREYLLALKKIYEDNGVYGPFVTCDGVCDYMLDATCPDEIYACANFGVGERDIALKQLKKYQPNKVCSNMELWTGGGFVWGRKISINHLDNVKALVEMALNETAMMNMYMYHGGTTFGFMNGSYFDNGSIIHYGTSYDVQAPVNEYGKKTEKYYMEQKLFCDYFNIPIVNQTPEPVLSDYGKAKFVAQMPLNELPKKHYSTHYSKKPLNMEEFDQGYGYIAYTKEIEIGEKGAIFIAENINDRATVYIDGKYYWWFERNRGYRHDLPFTGKHTLTIFVENLGRTNHGWNLKDKKGIVGEVVLFDKAKNTHITLEDWEINCYPFETAEVVSSKEVNPAFPYLYKFEIELTPENDTYLEVKGFERGFVMINGFNLGRHWRVGPQKSLYVPKSLLKDGVNEIIVFDVHHSVSDKQVILHGLQILEGQTDL